MENYVRLVLVGIGGYGNTYLRELYEHSMFDMIQGVVDIYPENSTYYEEIKEHNIPIFSSLEAFYEECKADLAIISTPIHFHTKQTICALENGSNVLCEKPMSPVIEDAKRMIQLKEEKNKFVAIGFDWSFSDVIQNLKQDIIAGMFGKAKRMKTLVLWPRNEEYYERASWAGKKYAQDGTPIFDSVANNATSHFLHNMFYVLGDKPEESAPLDKLTAELYCVNDIETFDTCAFKGVTDAGTEIYYFASHAVTEELGPVFEYEFEDARILYKKNESIVVYFDDGTEKIYGEPEQERSYKLFHCIKAVQENRKETLCGPNAALSHVYSINAIHQSVPQAYPFPKEFINYDAANRMTSVQGLNTLLKQCYEQWLLPSETKEASWTRQGSVVSTS
ncbi:gfo/Idh/MocA family oxidoreductase [Salibacterium salarium]|uniref:Gfo/Idh/MocA family oxidoreductase n=1 Tax=Salibacterium salarium TaxID=284579 RepID=A0A3R9QWB8_9BACI|nr:Gfo/Idh/MocA family oxidoreductase [Salibacterium salarium]RSL34783.1 gfo/Idh/MocA family oxidoreductase [Salibacterium salarium]